MATDNFETNEWNSLIEERANAALDTMSHSKDYSLLGDEAEFQLAHMFNGVNIAISDRPYAIQSSKHKYDTSTPLLFALPLSPSNISGLEDHYLRRVIFRNPAPEPSTFTITDMIADITGNNLWEMPDTLRMPAQTSSTVGDRTPMSRPMPDFERKYRTFSLLKSPAYEKLFGHILEIGDVVPPKKLLQIFDIFLDSSEGLETTDIEGKFKAFTG